MVATFYVPTALGRKAKRCLRHVHRGMSGFPMVSVGSHEHTVILAGRRVGVLGDVRSSTSGLVDPLRRLRSELDGLVDFFVVPVFTFTGTNVSVSRVDTDSLFSKIKLTMVLTLMLKGFLNMFVFSFITVGFEVIRLPTGAA